MNKRNYGKRYLIFLVGLFINSFGVSFITKASLGTSPISSIPYVLSLGYDFTLGEFTFVFNLLLILLQIVILGKQFKKESWLQIPVVFLFSFFIDLTMYLLGFMNPENYMIQIVSLLVGCMILGFGVYVEVLADVVMLPGESFVNAIVTKWHTEFGKTKVVFDSSMAVIAAVMSMVLFDQLKGVREGTVVAALLVGMVARWFHRKLSFLPQRLFEVEEELEKKVTYQKNNHVIITISREYGSNGRKIGKLLAQRLGLDFYDREIIEMEAKETNLSEIYIEKNEQRLPNGILHDFVSQTTVYAHPEEAKDRLYEAATHAVKKIADKGNCVIVGRCADHILSEYDNCYKIFLYADDDTKTKEIMEREQMDYHQAMRHMTEINRERYKHYKYYTGKVFGLASNYHLMLDTGKTSEENIVNIIQTYVN
ncbi:cytidylate kinase [Lachnospiraceae bacterium KM106-2]|nr:cytidylate kinase [Lachnospiraceae bacterium KM106-2]